MRAENRVTHFEITATEVPVLQAFYEQVFGWEFEKWEHPDADIDYWLLMTGAEDGEAGIDGGMMPRQHAGQGVINTIEVTDIDVTLELIQDRGGTIVQDRRTVPEVGVMAYFEDPQGNVFGIMQRFED